MMALPWLVAFACAVGYSVASVVGPPPPQRIALWLLAFLLAFAALAWAAWAVRARALREAPTPGGGPPRLLATREFLFLLLSSLLLRNLWLAAPPTLSDDVYRYRWEGRVLAAGGNPYLHPPTAPTYVPLRDDLWAKINHRDVPAAYPPIAQAWNRTGTLFGGSPRAYQALSACAEIASLPALAFLAAAYGLPPLAPALYLWHPLVLAEGAGNAHHDSIGICLLLWALVWLPRSRPVAALLATGAGLVKPIAFFAFPALLPELGLWALLAAPLGVLAYFPFREAGAHLFDGLLTYLKDWEFNAAFFSAGRALTGSKAAVKIAAVAIFSLVAFRVIWRGWRHPGEALPARILVCLGAFLLLSPTVHPWYLTWLVPFVALSRKGIFLLVWTGTVALAYVVVGNQRASGVWTEPDWLLWFEYGIPLAALSLASVPVVRRAFAPRSGPQPAVLVFAKPEVAGEVKTRLVPPLSPAQAADLYRRMLSDAVTGFARRSKARVFVAYDDPVGGGIRLSSLAAFRWHHRLARRFSSLASFLFGRTEGAPRDLGDKLDAAVRAAAARGYSPALLVGSDHPVLPPHLADTAGEALAAGRIDLAVVPAHDGGVALLGVRAEIAGLFRQIPWSTSGVWRELQARAKSLRLRVGVLPATRDVDTPEDLALVAAWLSQKEFRPYAPRTAAFLRKRPSLVGSLPAPSSAGGALRARPGQRTNPVTPKPRS